MARVPVASGKIQNQSFQQVAMSGARRQVRANADDFGGNVTQAMAGLADAGNDFTDVLIQHQQEEALKADKAAASDARNQLMSFEVDMLDALGQKKGREAFDSRAATMEQYEAKRQELAASLGSERAMEMFNKLSAPRSVYMKERVISYTGAELTRWESDVNKTALTKYTDDAIQFGVEGGIPQPVEIERFMKLGERELMELAGRENWPPTKIQQAREEHRSGIHNRVIARLAGTGDFATAQKYYQDNIDEVSGAHRGKIEAVLKDGFEKVDAAETANTIWSGGGNESSAEKLAFALGEVAKIEDPDKQDKVRNNILESYRADKLVENARQDDAYDEGWGFVQGGGNPNDLPMETKLRMGPQSFSSLTKLFQVSNRRDRQTSDKGAEVYEHIMTLEGAPTREDVQQLRNAQTQMSEEDYAEADRRTRTLMADAAGAAKAQEQAIEDQQENPLDAQASKYFKDVLDRAGLSGGKNAAARGSMRIAATRAIEAFEAENGRKATFAEKKQIIDRSALLVRKEATASRLWLNGGTVPVSNIDDVDQIPAADLAEIKEGFQKAKAEPREEDLIQAYKDLVMQRNLR